MPSKQSVTSKTTLCYILQIAVCGPLDHEPTSKRIIKSVIINHPSLAPSSASLIAPFKGHTLAPGKYGSVHF